MGSSRLSGSLADTWKRRARSRSGVVCESHLYFERRFDFYRNARWQRSHTNCCSSMRAGITEYFNHEVGCAVHYLWSICERGDAINKPAETNDLNYTAPIAAKSSFSLCKDVQCALLCGNIALPDSHIIPQLPHQGWFAVLQPPGRKAPAVRGLVHSIYLRSSRAHRLGEPHLCTCHRPCRSLSE
jgi:hypothetical protein